MELLLIHITDIHFRTEQDYKVLSLRSKYISKAIKKHIIDENNTVLILALTGDITYSGSKEQYLLAYNFLSDIIDFIKKRYDILPIEIIIVPGNHDCNFDKKDMIREALLASDKLDMSDSNIIKMCTNIQEEYFNFINMCNEKIVTKYTNANCKMFYGVDSDKILTINELNYPSINIKFHCFNTVWCSTLNEEPKKMKIHIPTLKDKSEKDIIITLLHHDEAWLDWESAKVWREYYKRYSDIVLVGHDHNSEIVLKDNYGAATNYFIKGNQLYNSNNLAQSGFNILKLDLRNNREQIFLYEWNEKLYENKSNTQSRPFIRNRFSKSKIELKEEVLEYIEDIEINLSNKYKRILKLSDIYVYPILRIEDNNNKRTKTFYKGKEEIIKFIKEKKIY